MIKYALKCANRHQFESWFKSADAFDALQSQNLICCPICGQSKVEKALMAPRIGSHHEQGEPAAQASDPQLPAGPGMQHVLTVPASPAEQALRELREKIQKNSEYVGREFAREARAIHSGDAPERSIYGEADAREARELVEEGVPVAPLPVIPLRKTN